MSMEIKEIKGRVELTNRLRRLAAEYPKQVGAALYQEAEIERAESMRKTPVLWSNLKGSHRVHPPDFTGGVISVQITVGDAATPYALRIHEDLEMFHTNGEAKFLESTLLESAPHMAQRVAARLDIGRFGL